MFGEGLGASAEHFGIRFLAGWDGGRQAQLPLARHQWGAGQDLVGSCPGHGRGLDCLTFCEPRGYNS